MDQTTERTAVRKTYEDAEIAAREKYAAAVDKAKALVAEAEGEVESAATEASKTFNQEVEQARTAMHESMAKLDAKLPAEPVDEIAPGEELVAGDFEAPLDAEVVDVPVTEPVVSDAPTTDVPVTELDASSDVPFVGDADLNA